MATRVLIADEHRLIREAVAEALVAEAAVNVVAEAADGYRAVSDAGSLLPDLALINADLPGLSGIDACLAIKSSSPAVSVIVFSHSGDADALLSAIEAGADGYFGMEEELAALVGALERVLDGEFLVPAHMLGQLLQRLIRRRRRSEGALERYLRLTPREREVLALLVEGCDHEAVAAALVISPQTARTHIQNLLRKLEVHSRLEAVALAVDQGWVEAGAPRRV
ncbi:MAG: response regulator transcription factor [Actinomycetota bacterium]|nr:response regulator transcription factor [Actinomycetota bacterium]